MCTSTSSAASLVAPSLNTLLQQATHAPSAGGGSDKAQGTKAHDTASLPPPVDPNRGKAVNIAA